MTPWTVGRDANAAVGRHAAAAIEAFSGQLHRQVDLDTLTAELLAVVDQTMQPSRASLWLRPSVTATGRG